MLQVNIDSLPNDKASLHQIIVDLVNENSSLRDQLALLKAKRYGQSSEKVKKELDQQIEDLELRINKTKAILETKVGDSRVKGQAKRQKLPRHLPREEVVLKSPPKCPKCGGGEFQQIGTDISETLDYVPSSFKVKKRVRPRCVCKECETIVQADLPSSPIEKGKAEPSLLAHIIVQKYCNHLPLYRQSEIYEREGIILPRSTLNGWVGTCAGLLEILAKEIQKHVFSSAQIHGDDTPVKVLNPGTGKTKTGRIWTYVKDGRPHGDNTPPATGYFYSPDRSGSRPEGHLKGFTGTLHADAYAGYNKLYVSDTNKNAKITEAGCLAHTRRKFYEVTIASPKATIASEVLEQIGKIYEIESEIKGLPPDKRKEVRQNKSKKLMKELFSFIKKAYGHLSKKSTTAKAIKYALNNEKALMRYLDDGKIEIDNNAAERSLRSIAVGRKNWLFAGSDQGGNNAAVLYTIIETAKLNGVNPWKYLSKVLNIIQDYKTTEIADLLPWNF